MDLGESESGPDRPVGVVLNGAAGALLTHAGARETLEGMLRAAGFAPEFVPAGLGSLPERIRAACRFGAGLVVVGGGDGTIACAAEIAVELGATLGILPFGTMNVLAKDLRIPVGNLAAAVAVLRDGAVRTIDAAEVNGRLYLCNSVLGLPARLARFREAARGRGLAVRLWLRFVRAMIRGAARYGTPRTALRVDGRKMMIRAASLGIAVNPLDDASGRPFARRHLDQGVLALYAIRHLTLWDMVRLVARSLFGRLAADAAVDEIRAGEIEIVAVGRRRRRIRVMNDGEVLLLQPPLRYRIRPGALKVMAPRPPGG
jgi:diacylglycerol kinase family enzyme